MPKISEYDYTVTGLGRFPIDMLRYDWARPRQSLDSRLIEKSLGQTIAPSKIQLVGLNKPTADRWRSFGWVVSDVSTRKVVL